MAQIRYLWVESQDWEGSSPALKVKVDKAGVAVSCAVIREASAGAGGAGGVMTATELAGDTSFAADGLGGSGCALGAMVSWPRHFFSSHSTQRLRPGETGKPQASHLRKFLSTGGMRLWSCTAEGCASLRVSKADHNFAGCCLAGAGGGATTVAVIGGRGFTSICGFSTTAVSVTAATGTADFRDWGAAPAAHASLTAIPTISLSRCRAARSRSPKAFFFSEKSSKTPMTWSSFTIGMTMTE